jgi:hypothetical protein
MALTTTDRARVYRGLMRAWSQDRETVSLAKADLLAAVEATDTWIEENQASYNAALPLEARNNLTSLQKTVLFCAVALARAGIPLLRRVFGEVD